jgi:hypothetical protein
MVGKAVIEASSLQAAEKVEMKLVEIHFAMAEALAVFAGVAIAVAAEIEEEVSGEIAPSLRLQPQQPPLALVEWTGELSQVSAEMMERGLALRPL